MMVNFLKTLKPPISGESSTKMSYLGPPHTNTSILRQDTITRSLTYYWNAKNTTRPIPTWRIPNMGNAKSKKPLKQRSALFESSSSHFTTEELKEMQIKFRGLAKRSDGPTVDQATFMKFMKFEDGLLGEQLFTFFDSKQNGVVDFEEFICGLVVFFAFQ